MTLFSKRITAGIVGLMVPLVVLVPFIAVIDALQISYPQFVDARGRTTLNGRVAWTQPVIRG
jgi:hypothetical protein